MTKKTKKKTAKKQSKKQPKKMGRSVIKVDMDLLERLCSRSWKCTDVAYVMGVSYDTIERRIKSTYDCTFAEYLDKTKAKVRMKLFEKQLEVAFNGNPAMLIWLGKQMLDQKEKHESEVSHSGDFVFVSDDDPSATGKV